MNRRGFLGGLIAALAAPAVIRTPGLLMPIKQPVFIPLKSGLVSYGELAAITRKAFVPRLFVEIYFAQPELRALFADATPETMADIAFPEHLLAA
jgi:hypothetical protein